MRIYIFLQSFMIMLLLSGCGSENHSSSSGPGTVIDQATQRLGCEQGEFQITGCWIAKKCDEAILGEQSLGRWADKVYSFYANGTTKSVEIQYDNADCAGTPKLGSISPFFDHLTYVELGSIQTSDELSGFSISFTHTDLNQSYTAIYHITNDNRLCFTSNIVLGALYNSFGFLGSDTSIDFANCLQSVY